MKDPLYGDTIGSDDEDADVPEAFANARGFVRFDKASAMVCAHHTLTLRIYKTPTCPRRLLMRVALCALIRPPQWYAHTTH